MSWQSSSRANIIELQVKEVDYIGSMGDGVAQSAGQMNRRGVDPYFHPDAFKYDAVTDTYNCPGGKTLRLKDIEERTGRTNYKYRAESVECRECAFKGKCCPQNCASGRRIVRGVDAPVVKRFIEKMQTEEAKQIYRQRGGVAEFTNAWLKEKICLRKFCVRGLIKAGMETLWACLTYNIKQWIRLRWKVRYATT